MSGPLVTYDNGGIVQTSHSNSRQRRLRSVVWNDFTKEFKEDGSDIATCNHCKRKFTGASRSGTTHLRNHLRFCASYERAKRRKLVVVRAQSSQLDVKNSDGAILLHEEVGTQDQVGDSSAENHDGSSSAPIPENAAIVQSSSTQPIIRRRRLRSVVWNDFTKEQREDGSLVAICSHCKKHMAGGSSSGTTHLKKHLANCGIYQRLRTGNVDLGKPVLKWIEKTKDEIADHERPQCDQELIQKDLAHMIILHEYPFSVVNHVGFRTFVKDLQPQFKLPSSSALEESCMAIYENKRLLLHEVLNKICSRVNITVNIWNLSEDDGYLCLGCHFIDDDWKLQKKIINFWHVESPYEGEGIAKSILEKLYEWNIDKKLFSVVLDSSSTSDKVSQELVQFLRPKQALILDGELFHVRASSHILNLIVQDGLEVIGEVIKKIRDSVKYVRSSHARLERFEAVAKQVGAPQKSLLIDAPSRWTTTYLMIETACEFQDAFSNLAESDSEYIYCPSSVEWNNLKSINECLRVFYQMTVKISSSISPTANHCFNNICGVHLSLRTWSIGSNPLVSPIATKMLEQFERYWGITSIIPAAASILDPRYKMKSVEYFSKLIYTDESEAEAKIENVLQALKNLFNEYAVQLDKASSSHSFSCKVGSSIDNSGADCRPNGVSKGSPHNTLADLRFGLDQYLQETSSCQPVKSDLDLYLEEVVHPLTKGHGHDDDFDILAWWKRNAAKYPVLSAMARDILGIPLSIAFQDSAASNKERVLRHYQCSMNPVTLQGLICAQDWTRSEIEGSALDELPDALSTIFTTADLKGNIEGYL